ncbi:MAG: ATP-binding protein [Proteobacteria bacterium]|nr:ATP-binding protein [Pseudomonadota bacterium]
MMQGDLTTMTRIAESFVDTKINLLKAYTETVAVRVATASPDGLSAIFEQAQQHYPQFLSFTVLDRRSEGYIGNNLLPLADRFAGNKYLQNAFQGKTTISTTQKDPETGELIISLFAPVDADRVLSVTISGMYFRQLLANVEFWDTGRLFMLDEYGTLLAHPNSPLYIEERYNFKEIGGKDPAWASVGAAIATMLKADSGNISYDIDGQRFISAWQTLTNTTEGWVLCVSVPFRDTPVTRSQHMLLLAAAIFLGIAIFITFLFSGHMARPFILIEEQNKILKDLNEAIVLADEAKTHFLANMSHEMRTPLNAVIGLTELMLRDEPNFLPEHVQNLEKIFDSGSTLLGIINDILDISKINSGKFEIISVEYDLAPLINDAVQQNMVRLEGKSVQMKLLVNPDMPATLLGDDLRIKQILNNVLSNACKYTHAGTVSLNISGEAGEGDEFWLLFTVQDTGIGILPGNLEKIFDYYYQVDTKANRKIEGTGLGLPITKHLIKMMDGTITVESKYGCGSSFAVRIRQKTVGSVPIGKEIADSLANFSFIAGYFRHELSLSRQVQLLDAKVLVVDDMPVNLDVAKGLMKPYGMQIDYAEDGQTAIDLIRAARVRYDAVFMDHMMPELDGIETVRIIREEIDSEYARTVPIIALTASAMLGSKEMFLQHGFQAFLSKPIDIMQLDLVIRKWILGKHADPQHALRPKISAEDKVMIPPAGNDRQILGTDVAAETVPAPWVEGEIDGLNFARGLERFGGDMPTYLEIVRSYVHHTPASLEKVRAVTPETLADYAIIVHGIKGSSRHFDAETVGNLAEALEHAAKAGDFAFVQAHNPIFLETTEKLLAALSVKLESLTDQKPVRVKPDPMALEALRQSCETFDIDRVDQAMLSLTSYEYSSDDGAELMAWLEEKARRLDFKQIAKRLEENRSI